MAIFDHAPEVLRVFPAVLVDDGYGGVRPGEGEPITVRAYVQPLDSEDGPGWDAPERYKVMGRSLPVNAWSRVEMWGRVWTVKRQPRVHGASRRTRFATAELVEKSEITQGHANGNGV